MSRIGIKPVQVPQGVKVTVGPDLGDRRGSEGQAYPVLRARSGDRRQGRRRGRHVVVTRKSDSKQARAYHGLYRNLVNNMVIGVSAGFTRALVINGVGYRAEVQGKVLILSLGYSTDFGVAIPEGLAAAVEANGQKVVISGRDRALVGKFASEVRGLRLPEPYKGKGIRYEDEKVRKKVGKTGVK